MATIKQLREGILTRLQEIDGLRAVSHAPDRVSPPAAAIELSSLEFGATYGPNAVDTYQFTIRVYTSRSDDKAGQDRLDEFINAAGDKSVLQLLHADPTLGGIAQTLRVTGMDGYGVYDVGNTAYYGAEFAVTVLARRS